MTLLHMTDPDAAVRRVWRLTLLLTVILAAALAAWTRSPAAVLGGVAAAVMMMLNFRGLVALSDRLLGQSESPPTGLQAVLLAGRYVLLGIGLCAMVLLPGVGPIPVALGVSVLVVAVLVEAILQLFAGSRRRL